MLAQFAAGLVHFKDYKRCQVLGDLLGVDDVTKPPPHDHRAALFLYRFLAELRTVSIGMNRLPYMFVIWRCESARLDD